MRLSSLPYNCLATVCLCLSVLLACSEKESAQAVATEIKEDSVSIWIRKGRDASLQKEARAINLDKALSTILRESVDSSQIKKLSKLSLAYLRLPDYPKFREVNNLLLKQARKSKDSTGLADAYWDLGKYYERLAVMDSSYYYYDQAHKLYLITGQKRYAAQMLRSMGVIQNNVRDYIEGERNIVKAIKLFKEIDDYKNLYKSYNSLGITAGNLEDYKGALGYYNEALTYHKKAEGSEGFKLQILNNMGMAYLESEEYPEAQEYFEQVVMYPKAKELNTPTYGRALTNLGIAKMYQTPNPAKPEEFEVSLLILDSIEDIPGLSKTLYALADFYRIIGDSAEAKHRARHALKFARKSNNHDRELAALHMLTQIDTDSSPHYSEAFYRLNDSLILADRQLLNKFARVRFETDEALAENETLIRQKTIWLGIAIGFLLLALAVYIIAAQRSRNQKLRFLQEQQETNQEIFNLMMKQNQRLEEGKQLEQQRISEELHDGVLGQMNGVRMVLLGLNGKTDKDAVKLRSEAIEKLQGIQEEIRNISHALSDASIQKVNNFISSVIELLKATSESSGLAYNLDYDKDFDWDNLSGEIKINLYRILQECLQNVVKHAQANEVNVEFSLVNDEIQATVKDNGRGFDVDKHKTGIGHKNIDSRVSKLGGSWYVDSRLGKGSLVIIFIPNKGIQSPLTKPQKKPRKAIQNKKLVG